MIAEPKVVAYGANGQYHWGQGRCGDCGAWLKTMPDRHERPEGSSTWTYCFRCVVCGSEHQQLDPAPPEKWSVDPHAALHPVGSQPPQQVLDPDRWSTPPRTDAEEALVRHCHALIDSLAGELTIHKVGHIWEIQGALRDQDVAALVLAASEYVNLLDYEAIHGEEFGSYHGTEGDTAAIRADLREIPAADELHAERGTPWRPRGRSRSSHCDTCAGIEPTTTDATDAPADPGPAN